MVLGAGRGGDLSAVGVYLMALPSRFSIIWRMRMGLARRAGRSAGDILVDLQVFFLHQRIEQPQRIRQNAFHLHTLAAGIEAGFQPPEVEQLIDQGRDAVDAALDAADEFLLLLGQRAYPLHQFGISQHGGQRRTQVVRNGMHEVAFHLVEALEIGDILHRDHGADLRDRRMLDIEDAPIVEIQLDNI